MKPPAVRSGLEVLLDTRRDLLRGRRFGLVCNASSIDRTFRHAADLLAGRGPGTLAALFGPEHGLTGQAQDMAPVGGGVDGRTGLPVHSLYGTDEASLAPARQALDGLDLVLVDLQDVGARYYTFAATMGAVMEACAGRGVAVAVLDRPNPIGGTEVEGNVVRDGFSSFVGRYPLAARHGMTIGELARLINASIDPACDLTVVAMEGWRREMWFDETGLPWVAPSPNMPTLDTATVYPGACLVEGTNLSEGRGTTRPFEWIGAPWLDPWALADALASQGLPGAAFRPVRFTPSFQKWSGRSCGGVQIHVTDRRAFRPVRTGLAIVAAARACGGESFDWRREAYEFVSDRLAIDLLFGDDAARLAIERGDPPGRIEAAWQGALATFTAHREAFLLY